MPETNNPAVAGFIKYYNKGWKSVYMISIAFTKAVVWKGRIRVNHSQCVTIAKMSAAVDAKKTNHQIPLYFFVCSIIS